MLVRRYARTHTHTHTHSLSLSLSLSLTHTTLTPPQIAIDAKTIAAAFKSLAEQQEKIDEENAEAQRELLKVKVDKVDVKFLAAQLNMTMPSAELLLRQVCSSLACCLLVGCSFAIHKHTHTHSERWMPEGDSQRLCQPGSPCAGHLLSRTGR